MLLLFTLSPTEATSAAEVAGIVALTTLPFTLAGPFAGVVLDRWRRQRIMVWTNLLRVAVVAAVLPVVHHPTVGQPLFLAVVLIALSVNRFLLAALGAVLPRVVPEEVLVPANSIASIGGSIITLAGAAVGGVVADLIGEDTGGPEVAIVLATALYATSALAATRLPAARLGPDRDGPTPPLRQDLRRALAELADGVRRLRASRRAWAPIATMSLMRLLSGLAGIAALLVFRNLYGGGGTEVALVLVMFGVGAGLGALLLTVASRRFGLRPETAITAALVVAGGAVIAGAPGLRQGPLLFANFAVGVAFALGKISADTLVQGALPDRFRGRVFAAYDILYNTGFLLGALIGAAALPTAERAAGLLVGLGVAALVVALVTRPWLRRMPPAVDVASWEAARHLTDT